MDHGSYADHSSLVWERTTQSWQHIDAEINHSEAVQEGGVGLL
jgi:hypothetical protein